MNELLKKKLSVAKVNEVKTFAGCVEQISLGNPVMLIERKKQGFALGLA